MQRRIPHTDEEQPRRRFTRRIVKKQAFQEPVQDSNIKVVHVSSVGGNDFVPICAYKAAGGGGGGPFAGAGGGPEEEFSWSCQPVQVDSDEESELMWARANRQKTHNPYEALQALKVRAKATLNAAQKASSALFLQAAMAKTGDDYNRFMDEHAVAMAEEQRLYRIVDDIEDRIIAMEFPGLFAT